MAAIEAWRNSRSTPEIGKGEGPQREMTEPRPARLLDDAAVTVSPAATSYRRYQIATAETPDLRPLPHRFLVKVNRLRLARLLVTEVVRYFGDWEVVLNRPCIYGVFSGPIGGFAPRQRQCVGCLRCTIQHPDVVRILPNPELAGLGDDYLTSQQVETIFYEAAKGRVPVKGQGYRGRFGGSGWDGMWTDMSEIVRPTRDGIHGREFISTVIDVGARASHLELAADGSLAVPPPRTLSLPLPLLFDPPPPTLRSPLLAAIWAGAAAELETLALLPLRQLAAASGIQALDRSGRGPRAKSPLPPPAALARLGAVAPVLDPSEVSEMIELAARGWQPRLVEVAGWDLGALEAVQRSLPDSLVAVRLPFAAGWQELLLEAFAAGVRIFHLETDYHGRGEPGPGSEQGELALDLLIAANRLLIEAGVRDQVTLLGSGGLVAAEHVPKAIIAGLDAVALDTALLLALQCRPLGRCASRHDARFELPPGLSVGWGVQRLKNLCASWRDQLLEVMGAMGLREVRRLRGELGRAMFQRELEAEAFGGIEGFPAGGGR
jgi:hypothetical protein